MEEQGGSVPLCSKRSCDRLSTVRELCSNDVVLLANSKRVKVREHLKSTVELKQSLIDRVVLLQKYMEFSC